MDELLIMLKALADETRLKIVVLLLNHDLCVGALAKRLNISEAAVSQHLQVLRKAGLARGEKRGYYTHYGVERDMLKKAADKVTELASQKSACSGGCRKHRNGNDQECRKEE